MSSITRPRSARGLAVAILLASITACEAVPEAPAPGPGDQSSRAAPSAERPREQADSTRTPHDFFDGRVVRDVESVRGRGGPSITDLVVDRAGNQTTYAYRLWNLGRITGRIVVTPTEQQHEVALEGTRIFLGRYPLDVTLPPIEIDDRGWHGLASRLGEDGARAVAAAIAAVLADPAFAQEVPREGTSYSTQD